MPRKWTIICVSLLYFSGPIAVGLTRSSIFANPLCLLLLYRLCGYKFIILILWWGCVVPTPWRRYVVPTPWRGYVVPTPWRGYNVPNLWWGYKVSTPWWEYKVPTPWWGYLVSIPVALCHVLFGKRIEQHSSERYERTFHRYQFSTVGAYFLSRAWRKGKGRSNR